MRGICRWKKLSSGGENIKNRKMSSETIHAAGISLIFFNELNYFKNFSLNEEKINYKT